MEKGASIPIMVTFFLVVSKMDGDMVIFFVSTSKGQGLCSLLSFFLFILKFCFHHFTFLHLQAIYSSMMIVEVVEKISISYFSFSFLCRCLEIWDEGVLVSREELDTDATAA